MKASEHQEQSALIQWKELNQAAIPALKHLFAIPNGAKLPYTNKVNPKTGKVSRFCKQAKILKDEGLSPGVPDLFLSYPANDKHGFFIELKTKGNKPSPDQLEWIRRLRFVGFEAEIYWSWTEAALGIVEYLGFPKAAYITLP
jgi:hypothetical protein